VKPSGTAWAAAVRNRRPRVERTMGMRGVTGSM